MVILTTQQSGRASPPAASQQRILPCASRPHLGSVRNMQVTGFESKGPLFLGVECGATRTVALLADALDRCRQRLEAGPANLRLMTDEQLLRHFRTIGAQLPRPDAIGIGMAGVMEEPERQRVRAAAAQAWPGVLCWAGNDLQTGLAAADLERGRTAGSRVLMICGTGSCCYGRRPDGFEVKVGGWGHLLSDRGSAYDIGLRALRAAMRDLGQTGRWPKLGQRLLRVLLLNRPNELVTWAQVAAKSDIAALAVEVFRASGEGDPLARGVVREAVEVLVADGGICATRVARKGEPVEFVFSGGVLLNQPPFAAVVRRHLRQRWPGAVISRLGKEGAWGALAYARKTWQTTRAGFPPARSRKARSFRRPTSLPAGPGPLSSRLPPTEQRNPRSMKLDRLPLAQAIRLMLTEEARIPAALRREARSIERAVRLVVRAFRQGGRLFYVGAGTSGRLGVLDASECAPTFGTAPELVQGIMAGGPTALWSSIEGAEDDPEAGAAAVRGRGVGPADVLIGIAASGRTPFVWGALREAHARRAKTVLLCFDPRLKLASPEPSTLVIAPNTGPEILTGSTRLKAGTATKLVLNMVSTLAMVGLGKVVENLMVDLNPSNTKLKNRAIRIVADLSGAGRAEAQLALEEKCWQVREALAALRRRRPRCEA